MATFMLIMLTWLIVKVLISSITGLNNRLDEMDRDSIRREQEANQMTVEQATTQWLTEHQERINNGYYD